MHVASIRGGSGGDRQITKAREKSTHGDIVQQFPSNELH